MTTEDELRRAAQGHKTVCCCARTAHGVQVEPMPPTEAKPPAHGGQAAAAAPDVVPGGHGMGSVELGGV